MRDDELAGLHVGLIAGDPASLAAFEVSLRPVVLGMLRAKGLPTEDADEVWNDAFLVAVQQARTIEPLGVGIRRLILTVAQRRAVDRIRVAVRMPQAPVEAAEGLAGRPVAPMDADRQAAVRNCLEQATPVQAAVIEMTARHLTAREIGQVLEISEASAAKIRQRARARLAECLKGVI